MWWMVVDGWRKRLKFLLELEVSCQVAWIFVLDTLYSNINANYWSSEILTEISINGNCWSSGKFWRVFVVKPALLKSTTYSHQRLLWNISPHLPTTTSRSSRSPTTLLEERGIPAFTQLLITKDQNYQAPLEPWGVWCHGYGGYV